MLLTFETMLTECLGKICSKIPASIWSISSYILITSCSDSFEHSAASMLNWKLLFPAFPCMFPRTFQPLAVALHPWKPLNWPILILSCLTGNDVGFCVAENSRHFVLTLPVHPTIPLLRNKKKNGKRSKCVISPYSPQSSIHYSHSIHEPCVQSTMVVMAST